MYFAPAVLTNVIPYNPPSITLVSESFLLQSLKSRVPWFKGTHPDYRFTQEELEIEIGDQNPNMLPASSLFIGDFSKIFSVNYFVL